MNCRIISAYDNCINFFLEGLKCIKDVTKEAVSRISGPNACEVEPHSKPWVVRLQNKDGSSGCAGTLVSRNIVLTAAHCVCDFNYKGTISGKFPK